MHVCFVQASETAARVTPLLSCSGCRCPVRLSNSQDVSLLQRVLITLVLRFIMNDGFNFDSSIACSELLQFHG